MENFDFSAPISATIIYEDESDEESIDIKPTIQECIQEEDGMSNDSNTFEITIETKTPDVGLDTPETHVTPTKNSDPVIETDLAPPTSPPKQLDMRSLENDSTNSENVCINVSTDDKIGNKSTSEDFMKQVNIELVNFMKKEKKKITNNKEISDNDLVSELNDAKNERFPTLSAHYTELCKILLSEKIYNKNDKMQSETATTEMKISQKILTTVETSVGVSEDPNKKTSTDSDPNTNCIQSLNSINCKNGSDEIQHGENLNQEDDKSKRQYSNKSTTKSNASPSNCGVAINETRSVSDNNYIINIEIMPLPTEQTTNQTRNIINSSSKTHNAILETVDYVKKLLDTVSEHLIYILNSYQSYGNIYFSSASPNMKEKAKTNYWKTKFHLFDLSYSSVVNIILPKKDDPTFVKNFLENTLKIIKSKSLQHPYKYVEVLYYELIRWVQKRQKQIQNTNMDPINNATLDRLEKLSQLDDSQEQYQIGKKRRPSSCSTQTSHPNRNAHQASYTQPGHNILPQIQNTIAYRNPPPPYPSQRNQISQALPSPPTRHLQPNTQPLYAAGVNAQPLYGENTYTMLSSINLPAVSEPLYCTASRQIHHTTAVSKQHQATNSLNTVQPYMTPNLRDFRPNYQEATISRNSPLVPPENSVQTDCSRSSISRDSGFMSPLNFQSNNSLVPEETGFSATRPLITHVTSLNPNATLVEDGYCKVCGKTTKQKCLGCLNIYYCSHFCQNLDWTSHQLSCNLT